VATRKRMEIIIETDRVLVIRRRRATRTQCRECGCGVGMIDLKAVQVLTGIKPAILREYIENKAWHSTRSHDGEPLVCLESLLAWCALEKKYGGQHDER
jgi:hypothetical protein